MRRRQPAGLRAHYRLIDIAGADQSKLRAVLEGVRLLGFSGINVTFPYKEAVVSLLDSLTDTAAAIGAVNTVVVRDGKLIGHNTDATGFARAFSRVLGPPGDAPVVLIGAGGVGRAIAFALVELGARELRVMDTAAEKATALAERLRGRIAARVYGHPQEALEGRAASSTPRQSACCRIAAAPCRPHSFVTRCGSPTRSIRRCGLRCCRRPGRAARG
jgi:shikimate dehydrogenase